MNLIEKAVSQFLKESASVPDDQDADFPHVMYEPRLEEYVSARHTASQQTSVDFNKLKQLGMLTPDDPSSRIAVELRHIKGRLLGKSIETMNPLNNGRGHNLIMLTSSRIDEGKTFLAINLAISIAMDADRKVVLVDTDVSNGDVAKVLGIEAKIGITELLLTPNLTLLDALIGTNVGGLHVVPAGARVPNAADLLSSQRMSTLLGLMAQQFADWLFIFDTPPLLAATESSRLARHMGQVVVVVHEEKTTQKELVIALKQIELARNIGLVLNKSFDRSETVYFEHYQKSQVF